MIPFFSGVSLPKEVFVVLKNLFLSIGHVFLEVGQAFFFILKIVVVGIFSVVLFFVRSSSKEDFPVENRAIDNLSLDLKDRVMGNVWND